jgi:cyanophycinase
VILHGGGSTAPETTQRLIALAGGAEAKLVVLGHVSEEILAKATRSAEWLRENGAKNIQTPESPKDVLAALSEASGVWIPGGDQNRLMQQLSGIALHEKLASVLSRGGAVGGSSAGAALMGSQMPTGEGDLKRVQSESIETKPALGCLENCLIDTHLFARQRLQRLATMILSHPNLTGIGVDEDAWAEVCEGRLTVRSGQIVIVQSKARPKESTKLLGGELRVRVLLPGDSVRL